jgi:hypothetical protein
MQTLKILQEAGMEFRNGELVAVDRRKAEAFHELVIDATDERKFKAD